MPSACCEAGATAYHRHGLALGMSAAAILAPLQLAVGDLWAAPSPRTSPPSWPPSRGNSQTEHGAGLNLGGFPVPGHEHAIINLRIPSPQPAGLRRPARHCPRIGDVPKGRPDAASPPRPPLVPRDGRDRDLPYWAVGLVLGPRRRRQGNHPAQPDSPDPGRAGRRGGRWHSLANELGWMVTEFGRQPWVIYGVLRTDRGHHPRRRASVAIFRRVRARLCRAVGDYRCGCCAGAPTRSAGRLRSALRPWRWRHDARCTPLHCRHLEPALTAYAVLGGADFGAGVLHPRPPPPTSRGRRRQRSRSPPRRPAFWEANHVWLTSC